MNFRVADSTSSANFSSRIGSQRARVAVLQERLISGKRINRPSDDPAGAEAVLNLRTSQTEIVQFQRTNQAASQKLTAADDALNSYEGILERVRVLVTHGLSDTSTQPAKNALASEIEALRSRILNVANARNGDDYLFGGTRQNAAPFDPITGIPAVATTTPQYIQIEPGASAIAVSVTADTIFSDATSTIFTDLTDAITALRGTGDPVVDRTTLENTSARLAVYSGQVNNARSIVGANFNATEIVEETLANNFFSFGERANDIEGADFAESALGLADAQAALDATQQIAARGRRSLFDFLG